MSTALFYPVLALPAVLALPWVPEDLGYAERPEPREDSAAPAPTDAPAAAPDSALLRALAKVVTVPVAPARASVNVLRAAKRPAAAAPTWLASSGESTRYRVAYGLLGELGQVHISFSLPDDKIHAVGSGSGSFLGLGKIEKRLEAQLVPGEGNARRWVSRRVQSGRTIVDTVEQPSPGDVAVLRQRSDRPEEGHRFHREGPVLDPLAFLWRLRSQPPEQLEMFEVLDGRALWKIAVGPTTRREASPTRAVLIVTGRAEPIFWDGQPDKERTARTFILYLEGDAQRTPLRLVMPMAVGEVRVDLTSITHHPVAPARRTALVKQARR